MSSCTKRALESSPHEPVRIPLFTLLEVEVVVSSRRFMEPEKMLMLAPVVSSVRRNNGNSSDTRALTRLEEIMVYGAVLVLVFVTFNRCQGDHNIHIDIYLSWPK